MKPLEKRDMAVDIIVASPGCSNAPVSDKMKRRWWADLQRWYGSNLKEAVLLDGVGHRNHLIEAVDAALRVSQADIYRSILIWRIDVAPLAPLSAPPKNLEMRRRIISTPTTTKSRASATATLGVSLQLSYHVSGRC